VSPFNPSLADKQATATAAGLTRTAVVGIGHGIPGGLTIVVIEGGTAAHWFLSRRT
jgi:hypothetical protein